MKKLLPKTYSLFGKNLTINPENLNIGLLLNDFKSLHNNSYYNFFNYESFGKKRLILTECFTNVSQKKFF